MAVYALDLDVRSKKPRSSTVRQERAQISRDLSGPKADWQLSGDKKRKRTFDSHECRRAKFDPSRGRSGSAVASHRRV